MAPTGFTELSRVPVRIGAATKEGALAPITDGETLVLRSDVPERTAAPVGANIDSRLMLDMLEDGTVFEVEVITPQSAWRSGALDLRRPASTEEGCVVVTDPGPKIYVDRISPTFTVDNRNRLHIELEPANGQTRWVLLSPKCYALLNGSFLAGFVVALPSCFTLMAAR
jgi:hypothetical protein